MLRVCLGTLGGTTKSDLRSSWGSQGSKYPNTWAPKVCKIMAFRAVIIGLGLLFYILLGFRYQGFRGQKPI